MRYRFLEGAKQHRAKLCWPQALCIPVWPRVAWTEGQPRTALPGPDPPLLRPASHTQARARLQGLRCHPGGRMGINGDKTAASWDGTRTQGSCVSCTLDSENCDSNLLCVWKLWSGGAQPPGLPRTLQVTVEPEGLSPKPSVLGGGAGAGQRAPATPRSFGWRICLQSGQTDEALWGPGICHCHIYNRILVDLESGPALCRTSVPHISKIQAQNTFQGTRRKLMFENEPAK